MRANGVAIAPGPSYVFDNGGRYAETRYQALSTLYDEKTVRHIKHCGIDTGWSCLEVGGGGGSIACWLCLRVGSSGRVLATDLDPRFLSMLSFPNLEVWRHDIQKDWLPSEQFDLVHARLVLMHLPDREAALRRMLDALKPGGWIVVEEFDALSLLPDEATSPGEKNLRIRHAFQEVLTARGVDLRYGHLLAGRLEAHGLSSVGSEASVSMWCGNSTGSRFMRLNFEELREPMVCSGLISPDQLQEDLSCVEHQDCRMPSPMLWSAWGRKPIHDVPGPADDEFIYW